MMLRLLAVGAAVAAVAVAASLGLSAKDDGDRVRIAYFANVGHMAPIAGIQTGIFADHMGHDSIETRIFDSGPQAVESLFSGSVDVAYVGPGPAINGFLNSEGNGIRILAGAASGGTSFVVHPDASIGSAADFAGKRIAAPQIGNTQDVSLRHYLAENGLRPAEKGGSVTVYNIPNPDIYTLFVKGEIDGAWVAEPWATILEAELGGSRLFHEEDLWPGGEFASVLLIGDISYAEENPEAIGSMLSAHHEAVRWVNENPGQAASAFNDFLEGYLGERLPEGIAEQALSNMEVTSDPKRDTVEEFAQRAGSLGYLGRGDYSISGIFYDPQEAASGAPGNGDAGASGGGGGA